MLGFNPDYAEATKESKYGNVSDKFIMDNTECSGTEETLHDCPFKVKDDCNENEAAGVICHGKHTIKIKIFKNCQPILQMNHM